MTKKLSLLKLELPSYEHSITNKNNDQTAMLQVVCMTRKAFPVYLWNYDNWPKTTTGKLTFPQFLQWWRRRTKVNGVLHDMHMVDWSSGIHAGGSVNKPQKHMHMYEKY